MATEEEAPAVATDLETPVVTTEEDTPVVTTEEDTPVVATVEETNADALFVESVLKDGEPTGLTNQGATDALAKHGYNEVVVKEQPVILQIMSRYLGIVPLFMTTTAVLSAAVFSECSDNLE
jgi:hypothetical protein